MEICPESKEGGRTFSNQETAIKVVKEKKIGGNHGGGKTERNIDRL
jgi:hypothetical protein